MRQFAEQVHLRNGIRPGCNVVVRAWRGPALAMFEGLLAAGVPLAEIVDRTLAAYPDHVQEQKIHNLVVDAGLNLLRDFLDGDTVTGFQKIVLGTGTASAAAGDTALGAEVFRADFTAKTTADKKVTITLYLSSSESNGVTLSEAGIYAGAASAVTDSGTLYARSKYSGIYKDNSVGITYSWENTLADDGV